MTYAERNAEQHAAKQPPCVYRITGPRGEGPFEATERSALRAIRLTPLATKYEFVHNRAPYGAIIAYEAVPGEHTTISKVGEVEVAFLRWAETDA